MRRTGKRAFEPTIGSEGMSQLLMTYSIFMTRGSSQDRKRSAARTELPGAGERRVFSHELPAQEKRAPEGARSKTSPFPGFSLPYGGCSSMGLGTLVTSSNLLAVQADVETLPLLVLGDAQADHHVDHFEDDQASHATDEQRGKYAVELGHEASVGAADFLDVEHAREECTDDAADTVHTERVQRVIVAEHPLHRCRREEAEYAGRNADDESARDADKTRGRSDRYQTRDCARGDAEHRRFALDQPLGEHP